MKIKERRIAAQKLFKLKPGKFEELNLAVANHVPEGMTRAYRNNRYTVMVYDHTTTTHGEAIVARIQRHDDNRIPDHWSELQAIKNEIFGPEVTAVEYYPAESKLENLHNIYWLFIYLDGVLPLLVKW